MEFRIIFIATKNKIVGSPLILILDVCKFHSAVIVLIDFEMCPFFFLLFFFFCILVDKSVLNLCSCYVICIVCDEIYVVFRQKICHL